jgi:hypothetical protein
LKQRPLVASRSAAVRWLLESDPSIRWQAMRDLTDAPAAELVARARAGRNRRRGRAPARPPGSDGRWAGTAWNRGWDSTMHVLTLLREMGLDPEGDAARRALDLVRERVTWQGCGPAEIRSNASSPARSSRASTAR